MNQEEDDKMQFIIISLVMTMLSFADSIDT